MKVKDVLGRKGAAVATIAPGAGVIEMIGALAEHRVGALVVTGDGSTIDGIVSERDLARGLHSHGVALLDLTVADLMTSPVKTCGLDDEVRSLARTMTDGRFRHMPVLADGALAGIVSIGDIVKSRIDELETEQDQLLGYISTAQ